MASLNTLVQTQYEISNNQTKRFYAVRYCLLSFDIFSQKVRTVTLQFCEQRPESVIFVRIIRVFGF